MAKSRAAVVIADINAEQGKQAEQKINAAGGRNAVSYCASKGAVVNITRAMAIDHGPQNIRVNCICPGDTDTPMLRNEARQLGRAEDQFMAEAAERPLNRYAQPIEIAQSVLYLVSDAANYVTGAVLAVDGGGTA